jgi:hypothetical protein
MLPSFQPTNPKGKLSMIMAQWPVVIIALGITLTFVWVCVLVWLLLRLLNIL